MMEIVLSAALLAGAWFVLVEVLDEPRVRERMRREWRVWE